MTPLPSPRVGPVVLGTVGILSKYLYHLRTWWARRQRTKRDNQKLAERNFAEIISFSLCSLEPGKPGGSGPTFRYCAARGAAHAPPMRPSPS